MTIRLDQHLVAAKFARSRAQATELIKTGQVTVNGKIVTKPSHPVSEADLVLAVADHYVSRAAHKLIGALADSGFPVPAGVVALDAGASTGGFTQVLLEAGAAKVFAVDVGHDQLHQLIKDDPRVVNLERLNLKELTLARLGEFVDLVVCDVSFISITKILEPILAVMKPGADALLMIKPQFEVGRSGLDGRGVVKTEVLRQAAIDHVVSGLKKLNSGEVELVWQGDSKLPGPSGNREHFIWVKKLK